MLSLVQDVKALLKSQQVSIDNNVFRLHYRITTCLLLLASLLLTSVQLFGQPILCRSDNKDREFINTFCWIHGTFTLMIDYQEGEYIPNVENSFGRNQLYHRYYQWVCFVLFFQAITFYVPRFLWKNFEFGKLKCLVQELNRPIFNKSTKREQIDQVVDYLKENRGCHSSYFKYFLMCEVLNFVNVVLQMYLVDAFLGGVFSYYGFEAWRYTSLDPGSRNDPMILAFPRLAKCTYLEYGSSGDLQRLDNMCLLALNNLNEKIYIIMWFWFIILAFISGLNLIFRIVCIASKSLRRFLLMHRTNLIPTRELSHLFSHLCVGDWFLLYQLCKNIEPNYFQQVIRQLSYRALSNGDLKASLKSTPV